MSKPNEIYQTLSRLREKYTDADDIVRINGDYSRIKKLFEEKDYAENPITQELIALCRAEILNCKKKLATDRSLIGDDKAQKEIWFIIESREWFLKFVVKDYDAELESLHAELTRELQM